MTTPTPLPAELADQLDPTLLAEIIETTINEQTDPVREELRAKLRPGDFAVDPFDERGFATVWIVNHGEPTALVRYHWTRLIRGMECGHCGWPTDSGSSHCPGCDVLR
jgi:hypothetical protein